MVYNGTVAEVRAVVATYATSGALASSRDTLWADSDLRAYWPCHRRDGTAGTPELLRLPQKTQPGLGTTRDDYGPAATCRSMDLAAAAGARATRMGRLRAGDAAGGRGPERHLATGPAGSGPMRQSGSTGLGEKCKSTRRGVRWVFIILTIRSFVSCESNRSSVRPSQSESVRVSPSQSESV
jgi:hypothetical protein